MEYIFLFFIGWFVGSVLTTIKIRYQVFKILAEEFDIEKESASENPKVPHLILEQHGDILYLFEKDSDTFMCQGRTKEELIKNLSEYKNINVAVVEHNSKFLCFINGEIKDGLINEN